MRRLLLLACLGMSMGCSLPDTLFGLMHTHYTDGGVDAFDKKRHYQERLDSYRAYEGIQAVERQPTESDPASAIDLTGN